MYNDKGALFYAALDAASQRWSHTDVLRASGTRLKLDHYVYRFMTGANPNR